MKKLSWPYAEAPESDGGPMVQRGDRDRDPSPLYNDGSTYNNYGALNPSISTSGDDPEDGSAEVHEYSGGAFFPLHSNIDELVDTEINAVNAMANLFISKLGRNSTIIGWGNLSDNLLRPIKRIGINVISLDNSGS